MITSRRGPQLGSWPLPAVAPVESGNLVIPGEPTVQARCFCIFLSNQENCTDFQTQDKSYKRENRFKWLVKLNLWSVICQSDFNKSNLCLNMNWSYWPDYWDGSEGLYEFRGFLPNWSWSLTWPKPSHCQAARIPRRISNETKCEQKKKTVQFLMVRAEVMSTNNIQIVELDSVKCLFPLSHAKNIQYTVDTIALDSYEDVYGFCLWLNHVLCLASCCSVGSSQRVFVSNGWTVLCGDEIQLLQTPCDVTATLST